MDCVSSPRARDKVERADDGLFQERLVPGGMLWQFRKVVCAAGLARRRDLKELELCQMNVSLEFREEERLVMIKSSHLQLVQASSFIPKRAQQRGRMAKTQRRPARRNS